jgi:hypothetical protein
VDRVVVVAPLVAFLVGTFVPQQFKVEGSSMYSALEDGDRVFVNKLSYRQGDPNRGRFEPRPNPEYSIDRPTRRGANDSEGSTPVACSTAGVEVAADDGGVAWFDLGRPVE